MAKLTATAQLKKDYKKINAIREKNNLNKIVQKYRSCLKCGKKFFSVGINNRLCSKCNYYNIEMDEFTSGF